MSDFDYSNASAVNAFPKLNSFNYSTWKADVKVLLIDRGSWGFVSETELPLSIDATDRETRSYEWRKARGYTTIYQSIERQFQPLIATTTDGAVAWKILKENFEPKSRARLVGLIDEFYDMRFNPDIETIGIFCRRITEKSLLVKEAGFEMPELLVCFQIIRRLPPEYDNLVQTLYRLEDKEFTSAEVENQLIVESGRILQKRKDEGLDVADAYATVGRRKTGTAKQPRATSYSPRKTNAKSSGSVLGHSRDASSRWKTSVGPCNYCHKMGHLSRDCFARQRAEQQQIILGKDKQNLINSGTFYTETEAYLSESKSSGEWLIDSAATSHFCKEKDWFINFRNTEPTKAIVGDKNCELEVLGVGDVMLIVSDRDRQVQLTLNNVLYAPNIRRNLIAGANIDLAKYQITWGNNKMVFYSSKGEYFLTVNRVNKLYILYGKPEGECYSIEDVHRRFGHVNVPTLKNMFRKNSVKGLENMKGDFTSCSTCKVAKSTRTSLKHNFDRKTHKPLQKVHMDLWGPSPVASHGGMKYFLSVIDDYTRKIVVYTIQKKNDVFECFKHYLARAERETDMTLKCVRTDNGLEFCNYEFNNFLSELGIKAERTSVYTPEQNGVAEKFNRTAMDGVRAMLHDSGLQPQFWAEALHTFVYIKNRCEHKLTEGKTPFELWSGYKPSVKHFKIFGSLAYVHTPKVYRRKLQDRAKTGIMVGYAAQTKGYRIWLPRDRKTVETIHVSIDETKNGVQELYGKSKVFEYVVKFFRGRTRLCKSLAEGENYLFGARGD